MNGVNKVLLFKDVSVLVPEKLKSFFGLLKSQNTYYTTIVGYGPSSEFHSIPLHSRSTTCYEYNTRAHSNNNNNIVLYIIIIIIIASRAGPAELKPSRGVLQLQQLSFSNNVQLGRKARESFESGRAGRGRG